MIVFELVGRALLSVLEALGRFFSLAGQTARGLVTPPFSIRLVATQMVRVGVDSIPVVATTAFFTGGVLALQTFNGFQRFHAEGYIGSVVALSMLRELAPVLTGLMVAGRAGSAMAAELGSMRVTEQIDALVSLATDPIQYLFVPRVLAAILVVPMLVVVADAVGIFGGYLVAVGYLGANPVVYIDNTFQFLAIDDLTGGLMKAAVFGGLLSLVGCKCGYDTMGGAEGVGRSTTAAVVVGSLAILVSDFFLTKVINYYL
jgi:phospholipid/cholesterol/gamma-HCH transport system permease protein